MMTSNANYQDLFSLKNTKKKKIKMTPGAVVIAA